MAAKYLVEDVVGPKRVHEEEYQAEEYGEEQHKRHDRAGRPRRAEPVSYVVELEEYDPTQGYQRGACVLEVIEVWNGDRVILVKLKG
jgi:hypothetical protein